MKICNNSNQCAEGWTRFGSKCYQIKKQIEPFYPTWTGAAFLGNIYWPMYTIDTTHRAYRNDACVLLVKLLNMWNSMCEILTTNSYKQKTWWLSNVQLACRGVKVECFYVLLNQEAVITLSHSPLNVLLKNRFWPLLFWKKLLIARVERERVLSATEYRSR